jgi:hypothetical protein
MALSLTEGRAGTLSNELFAVAENSEQLSARFSLSGNLFDTPNWSLFIISLYLFSTLALSARSIATVTTFLGLSSFTIVVTDVDGDTAVDGGGMSSLLPRSSAVEKLLNVDLSRFEDGDMLMDPAQQSPRESMQAHLRTLASSSSSGGGRLGREWKMSTEHSCVPASATSPSTSLLVSSISRFGTGYRTALSILTLPSIHRTDRS